MLRPVGLGFVLLILSFSPGLATGPPALLYDAFGSAGAGMPTPRTSLLGFTLGLTAIGPAAAPGVVEQAGFWSPVRGTVVAIPDEFSFAPAPEGFRLSRGVPNPFSRTTEIRVGVPVSATGQLVVSLQVFDTAGHLVRNLWRGLGAPGTRVFIWDGRDDVGHSRRSGMYFYRLDAPGARLTRRILYLK